MDFIDHQIRRVTCERKSVMSRIKEVNKALRALEQPPKHVKPSTRQSRIEALERQLNSLLRADRKKVVILSGLSKEANSQLASGPESAIVPESPIEITCASEEPSRQSSFLASDETQDCKLSPRDGLEEVETVSSNLKGKPTVERSAEQSVEPRKAPPAQRPKRKNKSGKKKSKPARH